MGLERIGGALGAGIGALGGVLADTWKDYFVCDSMGADELVKKGEQNQERVDDDPAENRFRRKRMLHESSPLFPQICAGTTMAITEGSKAARWSKSLKAVPVQIAGCNPPA